jgi:hypothetical protein
MRRSQALEVSEVNARMSGSLLSPWRRLVGPSGLGESRLGVGRWLRCMLCYLRPVRCKPAMESDETGLFYREMMRVSPAHASNVQIAC